MRLTLENYQKGFLMDEELMGGITRNPEKPESYLAFVLKHTTGEYLGYQAFDTLEGALGAINQVQRDWAFENTKNCGGCGDGQTCTQGENGGGTCKMGKC